MAGKEVNNGQYYFDVYYDEGMDMNAMCLSKKKFFDKEKHLDDQERGQGCKIPKGFANAMEAMWEIPEKMTIEEAKKVMLDAGFAHMPDILKIAADSYEEDDEEEEEEAYPEEEE